VPMLGQPLSTVIALHPATLPGRYGMGEIGVEAYRWLGTLRRAGQKAWSIPAWTATTGLHELSGIAGDSRLLSFDQLRQDGVLKSDDMDLLPTFDSATMNPAPVREVRSAFLRLAARRLLEQVDHSPLLAHAYRAYCAAEADWLTDWALFVTLHQHHSGQPWQRWPAALAHREAEALAQAAKEFAWEIAEHQAAQFLFSRHWRRLRAVAQASGIWIILDLPLRMEPQSADGWVHQLSATDAFDFTRHETWWRTRSRLARGMADAVRLCQVDPNPSSQPHLSPLVAATLGVDDDFPVFLCPQTTLPESANIGRIITKLLQPGTQQWTWKDLEQGLLRSCSNLQ
jgi:4-alpha-glucanotransferase